MTFRLRRIEEFSCNFRAGYVLRSDAPVVAQEPKIEHSMVEDLLNRIVLEKRREIRRDPVLLFNFYYAQLVLFYQDLTQCDAFRAPIQARGFNIPCNRPAL